MNRLQQELDRLYGLHADGQARVLVLELALPTGWTRLADVWNGVQSDLELPAPAIAVSGLDGLQLWFALASPVSPSTGVQFLEALRLRYLADVAAKHVRLFALFADLPPAPPTQIGPDRWSAFVTPDLAAVFAETPWLDIPPSLDGQAALLRPLAPVSQAALDEAMATLHSSDTAAMRDPATPDAGPIQFLTRVMNDENAPLTLRIDAAKALLPYAERG